MIYDQYDEHVYVFLEYLALMMITIFLLTFRPYRTAAKETQCRPKL